MKRFPILTLFGYLLRGSAVLSPTIGLLLIGNIKFAGFIASIGLGLAIWIIAEITGIELSIEANTYDSRQSLARMVQLLERTAALESATVRSGANALWSPRIPASPTVSMPASEPSPAEPTAPFTPVPSAEDPHHPPMVSVPVAREHTQESELRDSADYLLGPPKVADPISPPRREWAELRTLVDDSEVSLVIFDPMPSRQAQRTEIKILGSSQSPNSLSATLAYDKAPDTCWATNGKSAPSTAFVSFDLGTTQSIEEIAWMFVKAVGGAELRIQVSDDHYEWRPISTPSSAPTDDWHSTTCEARAQYVRFQFLNPSGIATIGFLREVRIYSAG